MDDVWTSVETNPYVSMAYRNKLITIPVFPHMMWGFFLSITYNQPLVKTATYKKLEPALTISNFPECGRNVDTLGHYQLHRHATGKRI